MSDLTEFGGFRVVDWKMGDPLPDPATTICRIATEFDGEDEWRDIFSNYLAQEGVEQMRGLVVGYWSKDILQDANAAEDVIAPLLAAADKLGNVQAFYMGDISQEESEISWIENTDLSPLWPILPELTHLGVRGGNGLSLGGLKLPKLQLLIIETGGLSSEVVREVMKAELPQLEHLEVYLGTEEYGASSSVDDLTPILDGTLFPKLKYLGLKNSDYQDEIAQVLADAPVLDGLETLDLSMGILTDEGGRALLGSERVWQIKKLDLNYHWMSEDMEEQLQAKAAQHGVELDVSDRQETEDDEDDWRYVALGE